MVTEDRFTRVVNLTGEVINILERRIMVSRTLLYLSFAVHGMVIGYLWGIR